MSKDDPGAGHKDHEIPVALIGGGAVVVAALITAGTVFLNRGGDNNRGPAPTSSSPSAVVPDSSSAPPAGSSPASPVPGGQVAGVITDPADGAGNVPSPKTITASGTVQGLQSGHHLLVFLQFGSQDKYWAGDPDVKIGAGGRWNGTVCIGDPGDITLLLVDVGPRGLAALKRDDFYYWSNGVPFVLTKLAPDVSILNRVSVTAIPAGTVCTKKEPAYY
jgi:hypothetical protein